MSAVACWAGPQIAGSTNRRLGLRCAAVAVSSNSSGAGGSGSLGGSLLKRQGPEGSTAQLRACSSWRPCRRRHLLRPTPAAEAAAAAAADSDQPVAAASEGPPAAAEAKDAAAAEAAAATAAEGTEATDAEAPPKKKGMSSLAKRAIFGTILGLGGAVVIILGGWLYGAVTCLAAYQCSQEFTGMVNAKGISSGMKPPPPLVSAATSLLCVCLNAWVFMTNGRAASAMAVATFLVLSLQLLAVKKPKFSQLTSSVFGLLYCGYLPSFWLKLRLLGMPAAHSALAQKLPAVLGGPLHVTVGLIATFTAVACIIAADTGAYFFGKAFGRTKLTSVSPKKTVEGAAGGLLCSIAVAIGCFRAAQWPDSFVSAAALGTIIFFASLFGDLIESVIKRDAGLKDASNLIPGHGGLLDRLDSYLFSGSCTYFWIKFFMPNCGLGL